MSKADPKRVEEALVNAGVEIYRAKGDEIHVAERVRLHIMDSGVRVRVGDAVGVTFTARSQRSDFPHAPASDLFDKVRTSVGQSAGSRGYRELAANTIEVKDPVDQSRVLDVWHEVTYEKLIGDVDGVVDEVRWALHVDKYVQS